MRKLIAFGVAMAALVLPTTANAHFSLGARVGYSFGMGDIADPPGSSAPMSDFNEGQVPIQLDLLFNLTPAFAIGGYASYGFGNTADDLCDLPGAGDCEGRVWRVGVQGIYSLRPMGTLAPWLGAGIGYEWNTADDGLAEGTFKGWEFLNLQVGADFRVAERFWAGPFVMFSLGQYQHAKIERRTTGTSEAEIPEKALHEWLTLGVRGKFDF